MSDVVTIEEVGRIALVEEVVFEGAGDCGFSGRGEAGEPESEAGLMAEGGAGGVSQGLGVPGYVSA